MAPPSPTEFREVGRISHSSLLRELRVWVKCLFLQLHRFLGKGITHKVNFLRGWSQVLSKKTKQTTHGSWKGSAREQTSVSQKNIRLLTYSISPPMCHLNGDALRNLHHSGLSHSLSWHKISPKHRWLLHPAQNSLLCSRPTILNCLLVWSSGCLSGISKHKHKTELGIPLQPLSPPKSSLNHWATQARHTYCFNISN